VCGHVRTLVILSYLTAKFTVNYLLLVGNYIRSTMKMEDIRSLRNVGELLTNYAVSHPIK
jgi:hypothetical protein